MISYTNFRKYHNVNWKFIILLLIVFLLSKNSAFAKSSDETEPKIVRITSKDVLKKSKKTEPKTNDILKAVGSELAVDKNNNIDDINVVVDKLGYDNITGTDGVNIKTPKPKPKKPYLGNFSANTLMASNGLIEIPSPEPIQRGKFQVGVQYLNRRIQSLPDLQLNARVMFQTLTFGVLRNGEIGFGSSGYYKSTNNSTFLTGKLRLTNPERSKYDLAIGVQSIDFGSSDVENVTNYYGAAAFDLHGSKVYFQLINNGNNKYYDLTVRGGVIIHMNELVAQPSALIIEALQDINNNFSRYNFGIRTAFAENAIMDLFLMKDINLNELSPAVGASFKF